MQRQMNAAADGGHIANYPARLIEQLIRDDALTVEERNELIQFELKRRDVTQE